MFKKNAVSVGLTIFYSGLTLYVGIFGCSFSFA